MAFQTVWYETEMPDKLIDIIIEDLNNQNYKFDESKINGDRIDKKIRNSKNSWVDTSHWVGGLIWHYVMRANRENFLYDITCVDSESIQYTSYSEGEYYNWHVDSDIDSYYKPEFIHESGKFDTMQDASYVNNEYVRKLSFIVQLSDPDEYKGGEVQLLDNTSKSYFIPKIKGTVAIFDSRTRHRVKKVRSGNRKSLVGWVVGPRFK